MSTSAANTTTPIRSVSAGQRADALSPPKRPSAHDAKDFGSSVVTVCTEKKLKRDATGTLAEIGISLPEAVRVL